jgi:hypothetical protein
MAGAFVAQIDSNAGQNKLIRCVNKASVILGTNTNKQSVAYAGGLIGLGNSCRLEQCSNEGNISINADSDATIHYMGGLIGRANNCNVQQCYNSGTISGIRAFPGGLIGFADGCTIQQGYNLGNNIAEPMPGALIGGNANNTSTYTECYTINATSYKEDLEKVDALLATGELAWNLNTKKGKAAHNGHWSQSQTHPVFANSGDQLPTYRVTFSGAGFTTAYAYTNAQATVIAMPDSVSGKLLTYDTNKMFNMSTKVTADLTVTVTDAGANVTAAPSFAPNGDTYTLQGLTPKSATFTLTTAPTVATTYAIYSAATGGKLMGTVSQSDAILTVTLSSAPTAASTTYYISAQESGKAESTTRTAVTCILKPEPEFTNEIKDVTTNYGAQPIVWNNPLKTGDGAITFASDKNNVAEVTSDGTLTIKGVGTATITVAVAEGPNNRAKAFTYKMTISQKNVQESRAQSTQSVVEGKGAFTQPTFDAITGTLTYAWDSNTGKTYDEVVAYLKTLSKDTTVTLNYAYVANGNYTGTITGTIAATIEQLVATLQSIEITTMPSKLTYTVGESLDISSIVVTGTYSDKNKRTELITKDNITGFNSSAPAVNQVLTITVGDKKATYTVTINAAAVVVTSVTVKTEPNKTNYTAADLLDLSGLVVTLHKNNNSTEQVTFDAFGSNGITVNPANGTKLTTSHTNVTITHTASGKSVEQPITVNTAPVVVTDATLSPISVNYDLSSPADVISTITWNSATTVTDAVYGGTHLASPTNYMVSGDILTIKNDYLSQQKFRVGDHASFTISFDKGAYATLTVDVVDKHIASSNAKLADLTVGGSTVSGFAPDKLSYTMELPNGTQSGSSIAAVGATADDAKATVKIAQASTLPGSSEVLVTAENGDKKTYTINFTLKAAPAVRSSEKDVTGVTAPDNATISGTSITATVANSVTSQPISFNVSTGASWKMYRDALCQDEMVSRTMTLTEGANTAYVQVTAEDGSTNVYIISITRQGLTPSVILVTGITLNAASLTLYSNTTPNTAMLMAFIAPADATDKSITWHSSNTAVATVDANGKVTAVSNGTAVVNASTNDGNYTASCIVTVTTYNSSSNDSYESDADKGSSNDNSKDSKPSALNLSTEKQFNGSTIAKMTVSGTIDEDALTATISEQMANDAIKAANDAAKKSGKAEDGIALDFNIIGTGSYSSLNATIDAAAIKRLKEADVQFVEIKSAVFDVSFDIVAISEINQQSSGRVTVLTKPQAELSEAAKNLIGNRPVFDITVSYQNNDKTQYVTNFGNGVVTLGIAYKAADNEMVDNLFGVYVDKNHKPQLLIHSSYADGNVIIRRNSLSTYGVGYKAPVAFTDIVTHWAKGNIDYISRRDLISGMDTTTFAPDTAITRADFLMALGRLSGADMSSYKTSGFSDVKNTDTAMPYIEWAVENKIVQGIGNGEFGSNQQISRQDMTVMMVNFAKATGYKLPVSQQPVTFADDAKISDYAKEAVRTIQQTAVVSGKDNNLFDPQGNATRAEASTILRRFVEHVID